MNVVFVGAEMAPWSKTGGLGDVLGGLPPAMAANGHRVMVVSPRYDQYKDAWDTSVVSEIKMGDRYETVRFFHCYKRGVDRVFIDHPSFLERVWGKTEEKIYGPDAGTDYKDNQLRFSLLCQAALEAPRILSLKNNPYFSGPYGKGSAVEAKALNKEALQAEVGLPVDRKIPLVAFIGRLEEQKEDVQIVLLGTGKKKFERMLMSAEEKHPDKVRAVVKFNAALAHHIMAGADLLAVTSRFEPCGLIQLQGMRYGTVLALQQQKHPESCNVVEPADVKKVATTLKRAIKVVGTPAYEEMVKNCMIQDLSWKGPAKNWENVPHTDAEINHCQQGSSIQQRPSRKARARRAGDAVVIAHKLFDKMHCQELFQKDMSAGHISMRSPRGGIWT
ncbi:granule-bound starch synthase 1, chloroplastic/amyloplastic-like [Miscanthus floridulus]|uniref:granule-bound starch synthase 1, chloroplastic/amyloplastic-like n=1 Tax=Miscanthus floridulus TaxID=154761 RepID=UPI00345776F9